MAIYENGWREREREESKRAAVAVVELEVVVVLRDCNSTPACSLSLLINVHLFVNCTRLKCPLNISTPPNIHTNKSIAYCHFQCLLPPDLPRTAWPFSQRSQHQN